MNSHDWQDVFAVGGFFLLIALLVGTIGLSAVEAVNQNRVERQCLALGYPQGDFRWIGPNYCVKRVDQTDSVLVLPESE